MSANLSRREALGLAFGSAAFGCRSTKGGAPSPASSAAVSNVAELAVKLVTNMQPAERGGHVVVLLHGYGAPGDDLESLASALLRPSTRFVLPAAPLDLGNGGRAWWAITGERPRVVGEPFAGSRPVSTPALEAARSAVQRVLADAITKFAPDSLSVGGFSQGAMLALDVALVAPPAVARVAVLSGALLADAEARLAGFVDHKPAIFVSHGREDQVLPFAAAEGMKAELSAHNFEVTWHPFTGRHQIPGEVVRELSSFLFSV